MTNTIAPPTLEELNERIVAIEDLRNTWRDLPSKTPFDLELYCLYAVRDGLKPSRVYYHIIHSKDCAIHSYIGPALSYAPCDCGAVETRVDAPQSPWMDIETAPRDGTRFWAFERQEGDQQQYECWWQDDFSIWSGWQTQWDNAPAPTHWQPLPAPPTHNSPTVFKNGIGGGQSASDAMRKLSCPTLDHSDAKASHNHGEGDSDICGYRMSPADRGTP